MNQPTLPAAARAGSDIPVGSGPPVLRSSDLLAGGREVLIQHGEDIYRLKLTGNNKLILTK